MAQSHTVIRQTYPIKYTFYNKQHGANLDYGWLEFNPLAEALDECVVKDWIASNFELYILFKKSLM